VEPNGCLFWILSETVFLSDLFVLTRFHPGFGFARMATLSFSREPHGSAVSLCLAERTRIAREIHDNLAQELLGISVQR